MVIKLNSEQRKSLASFFNSLAVAWFVAVFATPIIAFDITALTIVRYLVNMVSALVVAHYLLKDL